MVRYFRIQAMHAAASDLHQASSSQQGFTLIEMMTATTLMAILAMIGTAYTVSWVYSANVQTTGDLLTLAYRQGKALAIRNPLAATDTSTAAGIKLENEVFLVCQGSPSATDCSAGGANVVWEASHPGGVTVTVNSAAMSVLRLDSRGGLIDGSGNSLTVAYAVNKGDQSESGDLY